jgi:predicted dehydrogenase
MPVYRHCPLCSIPQAYGSYQELIDDPTLTAIYVATPNGLHGDWAAAALKAGKHVLCEKPFTANAAEAKAVQQVAAKKKLLCREAFHYKVTTEER